MEKEIKIVPPEGYEIDKENSTFDCIKLKPIQKRWRDDRTKKIKGFWITPDSFIYSCEETRYDPMYNTPNNYNTFATEKQAKSALAMARISQIIKNDKRFGGAITNEEWEDRCTKKWIIRRYEKSIGKEYSTINYSFLAFHTKEQCELFFEENEDLVKDYLMIN